ncbi:Inh inhibitor of prohead protease gp21 [Striga asiatica]|uniref:Inh inhibitor of prohead protease gp21 n=1 Tax=Striga asiatica TaxID=4170 RepID=A0A5A7QMV1_STRAF|nr:Inh inhibitor of prohead protease gp21 [Striga asiatica]
MELVDSEGSVVFFAGLKLRGLFTALTGPIRQSKPDPEIQISAEDKPVQAQAPEKRKVQLAQAKKSRDLKEVIYYDEVPEEAMDIFRSRGGRYPDSVHFPDHVKNTFRPKENLPGWLSQWRQIPRRPYFIGSLGDETAGYQVAGGRLCWETTGAYEVSLVTVAATALTSEDFDVLRLTNTSPFSRAIESNIFTQSAQRGKKHRRRAGERDPL